MIPRRRVTPEDLGVIELALGELKSARQHLRAAGALKSARYVAAALKSAEGAQRHALRLFSYSDPRMDTHRCGPAIAGPSG